MSSSLFKITPAPPTSIQVEPGQEATFSFMVECLAAPDEVHEIVLQAVLVGSDGKGKTVDWLVPGPQRTLTVSGGKTQTATIAVQPNARTPRGESTIKLVVADMDRPNDLFAESAPLACEVVVRPVVPPPARKLRRWLIPVICGGVALITGAIFVVLTQSDKNHMLIAQKTGNGSGLIVSTAASAGDAAGIRCGDDCWQEYASGAKVTLHATPSAGSKFVSWRGACSGTADCSVTLDALVATTAEFRGPECWPPGIVFLSERHLTERQTRFDALKTRHGLQPTPNLTPRPR